MTPPEPERAENPRCTDFCRDGGRSRGHYASDPAQVMRLKETLARAGLGEGGISRKDAADMMYGTGIGYHVIADAMEISHEDAFLIVTGQRDAPGR